MKVVGAAYGRTGTHSLKEALEILEFGPCYHMVEIFKHHMATHPQLWNDAYDGQGLAVSTIFEGYNSVTDWPAADFYQEIMKEYPDAKVILTTRDPDQWWTSVMKSIHADGPLSRSLGRYLMMLSPSQRRWRTMHGHIVALNSEEEAAKAAFNRHNEEVRAYVPAEKLLEFSVKDGWEPLCSFLGVPVPNVPFPHSNTSDDMQEMFRRQNILGGVEVIVALLAGTSLTRAANRNFGLLGGVLTASGTFVAFFMGVMAIPRLIPLGKKRKKIHCLSSLKKLMRTSQGGGN